MTVLMQRSLDLGEDRIGQRRGRVDAADLGADGAGNGLDVQGLGLRHGSLSSG